MRIVVAMSGGVDSSVAAALLAEQGHDVIGLSMQLYDPDATATGRFGSCCSLDDLHDARRVAAAINIPHYILNFERQFDEQVVSNFVREYAGGTHAAPLRALQQRPEVRDAARARARLRRRRGRHGSLRARRARRGDRPVPAEARRRSGEGSVVFPVLAHAGAAGARRLPGRRSAEGRRARVRAAATAACRRQAGQPGDLLHPGPRLRDVRRRPVRPEAAGATGAIVDESGRVLGTPRRASTGSRSASARDWGCPGVARRRQRRCTCWR